MTKRELIEAIVHMPDDTIVVMSRDAEGNSYSPLASVANDRVYEAHTTWHGDIGFAAMTPELLAHGYGDEDIVDGVPCIVLWPTN